MGRLQVEDGRAGRAEFGAAIEGRQPAGTPGERPRRVVTGRIAKHDVRGQVLVLGPQGIGDPRAEAGPALKDLARHEHDQAFGVVVVLRVHRADEAQIVGDPADVGNHLRQLHPTAALRSEAKGTFEERVLLAPLLEHFDLDRVRLAVEFGERRLRLEEVHVARSAVLHQQNDRLRPGRELRLLGVQVDGNRRRRLGTGPFGLPEKLHGQPTQTEAARLQQLPARKGKPRINRRRRFTRHGFDLPRGINTGRNFYHQGTKEYGRRTF